VLERWWKLESILRLGMLVLFSLSSGMLVFLVAGRPVALALKTDITFVMMVINFFFMQGLALVWITRFVREHAIGWSAAFGFGNRPLRALGLAGIVMLVALPVVLLLASFLLPLLQNWFGVRLPSQAPVEFIQQDPPAVQLVIMAFAAVVLAPVAEEALFRGVLYTAIKQRGYPRLALWLTAILFGLIHLNLAVAIPLIVLALVFTWLYDATGNLLAPIAAHALFNGLNFAALLLDLPGWIEKTMTP
jgi:membrane protease YdiL (CAAX protease family)